MALLGKQKMERVKGNHHPKRDKQYDKLLQRVMDALDAMEDDDTLFWVALDKLRDYSAMRRVLMVDKD